MKLRRTLSCMMALLLVCSLPVSALADTYDLAQGSVTVNASESGQTVTHGTNDAVSDDAPVIIQSNNETPTTNTITITATENATANVTIQDVNIVISDPLISVDYSGQAAVTIDVADNASANVTLDGVDIDTEDTGGSPFDPELGAIVHIDGEAAVQITGNGNVTLELDGDNTVQSGYSRAGVEKNTTDDRGKGELTITDENGTDGSLNATGGNDGAGIGGGAGGSGSDITITGSAEVTATGGRFGSGIGGGNNGSGSNITITGSSEVTAKGGVSGAGIGGGNNGSGSNITIEGSAEVTAKSDGNGAGIGGGSGGSGSDITITGSAEVTAQGGYSGSGIGGGTRGDGSNITITGSTEVTATGGKSGSGIGGGSDGSGSSITITGSAEVTAKGGDSGSGIGGGSNGNGNGTGSNITVSGDAQVKAQGGNQFTELDQNYRGAGAAIGNGGEHRYAAVPNPGDDVAPNPGDDVAPNTEGLNEGWIATYAPGTTDLDTATPNSLTYKGASNVAGAQPIVKLEPTCTEAGHKAGFMIGNTQVGGQTLPATGHSFTNYVSNNDGSKTAKCDHCDATHTIPDPGSRLVREETVQNAAPYRVVGQDGKALAFEKQQKGGVLTITVDADFATLTGSASGLKTLKAQGVETIVFVTTGATSTFALADLLAQGGSTDTYALTHVGSTVTLTLSSGMDISSILK